MTSQVLLCKNVALRLKRSQVVITAQYEIFSDPVLKGGETGVLFLDSPLTRISASYEDVPYQISSKNSQRALRYSVPKRPPGIFLFFPFISLDFRVTSRNSGVVVLRDVRRSVYVSLVTDTLRS